MHHDEQQIRELVSAWMAATKANDTEKVLSLLSDDAVFLLPGQQAIRRADFEAVARAQQAGPAAAQVDGHSDIQEIQILGDWAFMWSKLSLVVTAGTQSVKRAGHTMTILKKQDGKWLLARDANMLVTVAG